jgi:heme oxygenase
LVGDGKLKQERNMHLSPTAGSGPRTPILDALRARTRALHEQVESGVDLMRALGSREAYRELLEGYLSLYRPFEAALAGADAKIQALVGWPGDAHVPLLERDLRALGATDAEIVAVPDADGLPDLSAADAMLGALYVVEGSQLGGQVIYREIQSQLQMDGENGAAFFLGDGEKTGSEWKLFRAGLEEMVQDAHVAADTACAMFGYFENGLSKKSGRQEMR